MADQSGAVSPDPEEEAALRVLAVEDEATAQSAIERVITRGLDASVETVDTLEEAVERIDRETYDVVVMDHQLPDGTGLEGLAEVRERRPGLPVVYLTGRGDEEVARRALSEGAVEYLAKDPTAYERLPGVVERAGRQWSDMDRMVQASSREPAGDVSGDGLHEGLFDDLERRTDLDAVLVHDARGNVLLSTLPNFLEPELVAARAGAWAHQSGQVAEATGQAERGSVGMMRGTRSLVATMSGPGGVSLVGLFAADANPPHVLRTLTTAARLVQDAYPDE